METDRALSFLNSILATRDNEVDCAEFLEIVARYVDGEVAGREDLDDRVPHHIAQCRDCAELYRALRGVSRLEADGRLPRADELWSVLEATAAGGRRGETGAAARAVSTVAGETDADEPRARAVPAVRDETDAAGAPRGRPLEGDAPQRRGGWFSLPFAWPSALPAPLGYAAAVVLVLGLSLGWWRDHQRMSHLQDAVYLASHARQMRSARAGDGSWARVLFDPSQDKLLVVAGGPDIGRVKCWLTPLGGAPEPAGEFTMDPSEAGWWILDAGRSVSSFATFSMTRSDAEPILQVSLVDSSS